MEEDDERLKLLAVDKTTKEIMEIFETNEGSIRSRIKILELREKYDK